MFQSLPDPKGDPILALIELHANDPRDNKIDLGVGVYRDENGVTPIFSAVKKAEDKLLEEQSTKAYVGPAGDRSFSDLMAKLVLGSYDAEKTALIQTVGGSGALRMLAELIKAANPNAKIWSSDVAWPNYKRVFPTAGLEVKDYPYFNRESGTVRFDEMVATLEKLGPDDVVLLQASCHNPTGVNLTNEQWDKIADIAADRGFMPFLDSAYQGFGDGLEEDAYSMRAIAAKTGRMMVAASCSKNFGIYRDRVGCAMVVCSDGEEKTRVASLLSGLARGSYYMPADHGAAVVRTILEDEALTAEWKEELEAMRLRMLTIRETFAEGLRARTNSDKFDYLATQRGMFSLLGIEEEKVLKLREDFGIYMLNDSRINIAGLNPDQIPAFIDAMMAVE